MLEIIIASTNEGKIREIRSLFKNVKFISLKDLDFKEEIVEDGTTFMENAKIKAMYIAKKYHKYTLADDSGLCVRALGYAPGVYSARYAGTHEDSDNNRLLVKNMQDAQDFYAYYEAVLCLATPDLKFYWASGKCEGEIILEARGENGFGYDPYFYLPEYKKTMAEISLEEKNKISHRAKALEALKPIIEGLIDENK